MVSKELFLELRGQLAQGRVLLPDDDGYEASLQRWSLTCVQPAAAVVQPATAEEVSLAVKFAVRNNIAFTAKGGGHSTSQASAAPSPAAIVIDLALMRSVKVDDKAQKVSIGGGCTWKDVDVALAASGLATPGGTVSHTGVGGLILHGGFGFLSGRYGLTIDVLLSCEVVLADGSIVEASETENPDLFWALRGAGSSFGIVTRFTSRAFPQGDVWGGLIVFLPKQLPALVELYNRWDKENDGNQCFMLVFSHAPPSPEAPDAPRPAVVMAQVAHLGSDAATAGPEFFADLLQLQKESALLAQVGPLPYAVINQLADETFASGHRYLFGGSNFTMPTKVSTVESVFNRFTAFVDEHPDARGSACMFEGIPNRRTRAVPSDATAFNSRGDYFNIGTAWKYSDPELDTVVREFNRAFQKENRRLGYDDEAFGDGVGQYLNYTGSEAMAAEKAFGANATRLRELKSKYDPENVFDKVWKLSEKLVQ